jgi:predicted flap endonuclease-1-like 5' DNA nuclease
MSQDPEDISKWIQELVTRSSRQQIQAMQRLSGLMQRVTSGELDQTAVREEYTRFIREESTGFVEDLTRLGLSFQTALLELNRKYSDRFFDQVLGSSMPGAGMGGTQATNSEGVQRREIGIVLAGVSGEELVKSFVIENKRAEAETVTFLVSEFTGEDSGEAFRPPLQIQPPRLALRPGEERVVSIHLPLLPELFKPDHVYHATILARGHIDVVLALRVEVSSPEIHIQVDQGVPAQTEPDLIIHEKTVSNTKPARRPSTNPANGSPAKPTAGSTGKRTPRKASQQIAAGQIAAGDDLTQIKGIGPTFAAKLNTAGVFTYASLSALEPGRLMEILGEAGSQRAERERWVEQAVLAAGGKGAGLGEYWRQVAPGPNGDAK